LSRRHTHSTIVDVMDDAATIESIGCSMVASTAAEAVDRSYVRRLAVGLRYILTFELSSAELRNTDLYFVSSIAATAATVKQPGVNLGPTRSCRLQNSMWVRC